MAIKFGIELVVLGSSAVGDMPNVRHWRWPTTIIFPVSFHFCFYRVEVHSYIALFLWLQAAKEKLA
jgi:hypothetical protein